jgi:uncharacterized protein (TIGR02246 family)
MKVISYCKSAILLILAIALFGPSARSQNNLTAKDIEAIKAVEEMYRAAWLKNDEKTILSLFTEDATLYPNGNQPIKSKAEIRKFWFAPSDTITTINTFEVKIEDVTGDKNYATLTGTNEIRWTSEKKEMAETKRFVSKGYFISVYVRREQNWKFFKQFWNGKTEEIK